MGSKDAFSRRMERERKIKAKEAAAMVKALQKMQVIEDARRAVRDYNDYLELLTSMHIDFDEPVDWAELKNAPVPAEPIFKNTNADIARLNLLNYKPGLLDLIFFLANKKKKNLEGLLSAAEQQDKTDYEEALINHKNEVEYNKKLKIIAQGIDSRQPEYYAEALKFFDAFSDFDELGTEFKYGFENNVLDIEIHIDGSEVVPDYELNQTSTGKLSKKAIAKGKFFEIYQDHACSCILRVGKDVFAYLPLEQVRVSTIADMLNEQTGHREKVPVVSAIISKNTINSLNMDTIDPSSSMQNFVHTMNFKKTSGFTAVQKAALI